MKVLQLDVDSLSVRQKERFLLWSIAPRPIAMISTISPHGKINLAPFSYFTAVGYSPMALLFCAGRRVDGTEKDTCRNARSPVEGGTGEFTINVLIESQAKAATAAARSLPHGESEYELAGLCSVPGTRVGTPRIEGSPIAFECRTSSIIPVGDFSIVVGEVVHIAVDEDLVNKTEFNIDLDRLCSVGRMGSADYVRTADRFLVE